MNEPLSLRITEVFTSLQGEALTSGLPTTFIRLTGCPLRCVYCDSDYAFQGGERRSISDLVSASKTFGADLVCVTGGEPLAQPNCLSLLTSLCDAGFKVSLETSGALDVSDVDPRVSIVLDLKTPGSGESAKNLLSNLELISEKDQIKVVVTDEDDFRWFELLCDGHPSIFQAGAVWISPSYDEIDLQVLAELIIGSRHPFRMQLQLHKQIWGKEHGR
ncbi:MAG TPA: 7-carboxy-7-deazaguanine synthase QueE [Gammaproteobacteria bacterium]|nr:7-carboxy-7-deazaguanine synthase QueE [Gammaproteobacteria bacterium]